MKSRPSVDVTTSNRLRQKQIQSWEDTEIAAYEAMLSITPVRLRAQLGLRVVRHRHGVAVIAAAADHPFFNRVYLRPSSRVSDAGELAPLLSQHAQVGVKNVFVHVHDREHRTLLPVLRQSGLEQYPRSWVKLAGDLSNTPEPTLQEKVATDVQYRAVAPAEADEFGRLYCKGFQLPTCLQPIFAGVVGAPAFGCLGAYSGGKLVALGLVFLCGEMAYLAGGATLPSQRCRGHQARLLLERRKLAARRNCRWLTTETGEAKPDEPQHSFRNLLRMGLSPVSRRHNFVRGSGRW